MSLCAKCGSACGNDCYASPETIRKRERERIIKLLEGYVIKNNELYELTNDTGWDNRAHVTEICIALIKGEK